MERTIEKLIEIKIDHSNASDTLINKGHTDISDSETIHTHKLPHTDSSTTDLKHRLIRDINYLAKTRGYITTQPNPFPVHWPRQGHCLLLLGNNTDILLAVSVRVID